MNNNNNLIQRPPEIALTGTPGPAPHGDALDRRSALLSSEEVTPADLTWLGEQNFTKVEEDEKGLYKVRYRDKGSEFWQVCYLKVSKPPSHSNTPSTTTTTHSRHSSSRAEEAARLGIAESTLYQRERRARALAAVPRCPTCGQPVPDIPPTHA